ncbi:MAG TPA: triose-phosphate isomerase [Candidatus Woesearchaeota archaeon]|nr:triose-phosphate isomerase [Candidatus Woesearchaeota archaeon]
MKIKLPVILVNFKAYDNALGDKAETLAKVCEKASADFGCTIGVAVQSGDIYRVSRAVSIPVFSEHIDAVEAGPHTGYVLAKNVRENGAIGTLLNHSEHRIKIDELEDSIDIARKEGLLTVVCASNEEIAQAAASLNPDFIAIEPPELIGTDISVSGAKPELVTASIQRVSSVSQIPVLCGAGIKKGEDVAKAIQLGVQGILVASAVTLSKNPYGVLEDFCRAIFQR